MALSLDCNPFQKNLGDVEGFSQIVGSGGIIGEAEIAYSDVVRHAFARLHGEQSCNRRVYPEQPRSEKLIFIYIIIMRYRYRYHLVESSASSIYIEIYSRLSQRGKNLWLHLKRQDY